jgi:hypothetical protein
MPIVRYEGRTFTKQVFELEECWFVNCVLRECTLMYGGGRYELENTSFAECNWKFHGEARNTMQLLSLIGLIKPGQAPPQQIQTKGNA